MLRASYEPVMIFGNEDATPSTRVSCVLPTTGRLLAFCPWSATGTIHVSSGLHRHQKLLKGSEFARYVRTIWKNGFVTATKLGTTNKYFVAVTKLFVDRTNDFVGITRPFIPCIVRGEGLIGEFYCLDSTLPISFPNLAQPGPRKPCSTKLHT